MPDHISPGSFLCWTIVHAHNSFLILLHTNGQRGFTTNREKGQQAVMMSWGETRGSAVSGWTTSHNCLTQTGQCWHSLFTSGKIIKVCWPVLYIAGVVLISPLFFLIPRRNLQPFQSAKQEWWGDTLIHFSTEMGNHVVKGNSQMNCFTSKLWRERTPPKELQQTARRS